MHVFPASFIYACFYQYGEPQGTSPVKNTSKKVNKYFHTLNKPVALRFYFCYLSERLSALAGMLFNRNS